MKKSSGILALISFALCLPVHAQDTANSLSSAAQPASVAAPSTNTVGLSSIRIVRLSQVRGTVNIDRHIGRGYEEAFANVPITGGTKLHTDVGLAEVEFEDNSTLRLTPDTEVEFTLLKRTATGSTISTMNVLHGMVFAYVANTKGNTFTITSGKALVAMNPNSHIRLTMDGLNSNLSVLDGSVEFTDPFAYTSNISHKKSLDFDASGSKQPEFAKLETTAFDDWDKNGNDYQKLYASQRLSGGSWSLRHQRPELLRQLLQRRLWFDVAAVLRLRRLEPVRQRHVGVLPKRWLLLGLPVSVGLAPVPLRQLGQLRRSRMGLAAGIELCRPAERSSRRGPFRCHCSRCRCARDTHGSASTTRWRPNDGAGEHSTACGFERLGAGYVHLPQGLGRPRRAA